MNITMYRTSVRAHGPLGWSANPKFFRYFLRRWFDPERRGKTLLSFFPTDYRIQASSRLSAPRRPLNSRERPIKRKEPFFDSCDARRSRFARCNVVSIHRYHLPSIAQPLTSPRRPRSVRFHPRGYACGTRLSCPSRVCWPTPDARATVVRERRARRASSIEVTGALQ